MRAGRRILVSAIRSALVALACQVVLLCLLPVAAHAQPQKWAVVIGIAKYQDSRIRALKYTVRDAQAVYQFLTDPAGGGFPRDNVRLLLNEQATQRAIKNTLGQFLPERAVQGDLVFMYYAGHGAPEVDRAKREPDGFSKYLVPYDADYADLYSTGINMGEVKDFFDRIESDRVVFVMDACFSGASGGRGFANVPRGRDVRGTGNYLDRLAEGKGRVILTASDANELSLELDSLRHGLFTYHFLQGLRGRADRLGRGYVSLQDVYAYTYEQVARESRRAGGSQSPRLKGDLAGDIILAGRPTPPSAQPPSLEVIPIQIAKDKANQNSDVKDIQGRGISAIGRGKDYNSALVAATVLALGDFVGRLVGVITAADPVFSPDKKTLLEDTWVGSAETVLPGGLRVSSRTIFKTMMRAEHQVSVHVPQGRLKTGESVTLVATHDGLVSPSLEFLDVGGFRTLLIDMGFKISTRVLSPEPFLEVTVSAPVVGAGGKR